MYGNIAYFTTEEIRSIYRKLVIPLKKTYDTNYGYELYSAILNI